MLFLVNFCTMPFRIEVNSCLFWYGAHACGIILVDAPVCYHRQVPGVSGGVARAGGSRNSRRRVHANYRRGRRGAFSVTDYWSMLLILLFSSLENSAHLVSTTIHQMIRRFSYALQINF